MTELGGDLVRLHSTGIGSWPGTDVPDAIKIAFDECPDLPYLPELPDRGPHASLIGRGTAFLTGLGVDLHPAGWRLTDVSGRDHRRAVTTLRSDLDLLEETAQDYQGPIKLAVAGPWTLAAGMEHPRGDRLLADPGARRELGQSLIEGVATMVEELRRRLPDVAPVVQLDEPSLPGVLAGAVPTASGLHRHRAVDVPEVSDVYTAFVQRLAAADVGVWVHCCAAGAPVAMLWRAGVTGVLLDLGLLTGPEWDAVAGGLEQELTVGLGALPTDRTLSADQVARRVLRPVRDLGLDPRIGNRLLVTPACGLARLDRTAAITALRTVRRAAEIVSAELPG